MAQRYSIGPASAGQWAHRTTVAANESSTFMAGRVCYGPNFLATGVLAPRVEYEINIRRALIQLCTALFTIFTESKTTSLRH